MNEDDIKTGVQAIIEAARNEASAEVRDVTLADMTKITGMPIDGVPMVVVRRANGAQELHSVLDEVQKWRAAFATAPMRRTCKLTAHSLESFVSMTNRDKRPDSVIFADVSARKVVAVLDFHGPADSAPRFGEDRIEYGFTFSPQLLAWISACRGPLAQKDFSRLIDDRLGDIAEGEPEAGSVAAEFARRRNIRFATIADLVLFTRTIAAKSTSGTEIVFDEATGSESLQYSKKNDVKQPDGTPIHPPAAFVLKIPVLNGNKATEYYIACRIKFDVAEGKGLQWTLELHALDKYITAAVDSALDVVRGPATAPADWKPAVEGDTFKPGCGLPVYLAAIP